MPRNMVAPYGVRSTEVRGAILQLKNASGRREIHTLYTLIHFSKRQEATPTPYSLCHHLTNKKEAVSIGHSPSLYIYYICVLLLKFSFDKLAVETCDV